MHRNLVFIMESAKRLDNQLNLETQMPPEQMLEPTQEGLKIEVIFKKLRGGFFLVVGYLLSPLCWWNDLIFNLPVAYLFAESDLPKLLSLYVTGFSSQGLFSL